MIHSYILLYLLECVVFDKRYQQIDILCLQFWINELVSPQQVLFDIIIIIEIT